MIVKYMKLGTNISDCYQGYGTKHLWLLDYGHYTYHFCNPNIDAHMNTTKNTWNKIEHVLLCYDIVKKYYDGYLVE